MNIGFMSFAIIGYVVYENYKYKKQYNNFLKNHKYDK